MGTEVVAPDRDGNEIAHHLTPYRGGVVLSFRPNKRDLSRKVMQGYSLLYETNVKKAPQQKVPFVGVVKATNAFAPKAEALDEVFRPR